jgi:tRNA nucleotidyltransferase (CCA-adding enzyme)
MNANAVLKSLDLLLGEKELSYLKDETRKLKDSIEKELRKDKISADVFIGGSFAKGTLIRGEILDVDIFIRFDWKYEKLSEMLEKFLKRILKTRKLKLEKVHGSRDYFRIRLGKNVVFEVIPVTKIKKPSEMRNVTDLSYFHVNYVKKKLRKLGKEVVFAKKFCKAAGVYGAESYVNGFSGYGLECLVIYYKSFEKMLKELGKVKESERLIIDSEKKFKKKSDVLFELNESKLNSPIILIDPTWKERNALSALSWESFEKFKKAASAFLKKPSREFFEEKKIDEKKLKNQAKSRKAEFVHIKLETDKQEGDIAGTKMKKFSDFIRHEIEEYFEILNKEFGYSQKKSADFYLVLKSKKELIKTGPPAKFEKHAEAFRKAHKNVFEKNGVFYAKIKINLNAKEFLRKFAKERAKTLKDMDITGFKVI